MKLTEEMIKVINNINLNMISLEEYSPGYVMISNINVSFLSMENIINLLNAGIIIKDNDDMFLYLIDTKYPVVTMTCDNFTYCISINEMSTMTYSKLLKIFWRRCKSISHNKNIEFTTKLQSNEKIKYTKMLIDKSKFINNVYNNIIGNVLELMLTSMPNPINRYNDNYYVPITSIFALFPKINIIINDSKNDSINDFEIIKIYIREGADLNEELIAINDNGRYNTMLNKDTNFNIVKVNVLNKNIPKKIDEIYAYNSGYQILYA